MGLEEPSLAPVQADGLNFSPAFHTLLRLLLPVTLGFSSVLLSLSASISGGLCMDFRLFLIREKYASILWTSCFANQ